MYSAWIEAKYVTAKTGLIVIDDHADSRMGKLKKNYEYFKRDRNYSEYLKMQMPKLSTEMLSDFESKNEQSYLLKPLFDLSIQYVLMSRSGMGEIPRL